MSSNTPDNTRFELETFDGQKAELRLVKQVGETTQYQVEGVSNNDGGSAGEVTGDPVHVGPFLVQKKNGLAAQAGIVREKKVLRPSSTASKTVNWQAYHDSYEAIFGGKKPVGEG